MLQRAGSTKSPQPEFCSAICQETNGGLMTLMPDHHLTRNIWLAGSSRRVVGFGAHNKHQSLYYVAGKIFHLPKS